MSAPILTVLTPTWNAARFAREAAESVARQTLSGAIEHLVLDAGSTDGTLDEIRTGNPRATIVEEGRRDGLYAALNRGLARAAGRYVAWLNADDRWRSDAADRSLARLAAEPAAPLAFGDLERLHPDGSTSTLTHPADPIAAAAEGDLVRGFVTPLCCFWRTDALRALGPYDAELRIVADRDLWLRLVCRSPRLRAARVEGTIGTFREHGGSLSAGAEHRYASHLDHERLWHRWSKAPEATVAMRSEARRLRQVVLVDLAARDLRAGRVDRFARRLAALAATGTGWWRPIVAVPGNVIRRLR